MKIYIQDIRIGFDIEKFAMLVMKRGKWHIREVVELPNKSIDRTIGEKETFKYSGILQADTIKKVEMKEKILKEYLRRTRKPLKTKLY